VGLLTLLSAFVGLRGPGWFAGTAFALGLYTTLAVGLHRAGMRTLGPANQVTLARATLVGGVAALVADSFERPAPVGVLVLLGVVALALDGVDGKVARLTGSTTRLGARFDMEVDAFLIFVLSVYVARPLGTWVLAIGLMRYAFVAASWVLPWLNRPLPPSLARKAVAAAQGIALVAAASGMWHGVADVAIVVLALGSLSWSFGRDIAWLSRTRPRVVERERIPV
jgi:phosphatidylglycerophosphate synthase